MFRMFKCWLDCAVDGAASAGPPGGPDDPEGSKLFNNSEIRSRIVIPDKASQVGNHGEVLSVDNNAGTDRRLLEGAGDDRLKMRLGYGSRQASHRQTLPARCDSSMSLRSLCGSGLPAASRARRAATQGGTLGYMVKRLSASGGCLGS